MDFELYSKRYNHITGDLLVCGIYSDAGLTSLEGKVDELLDNLPQRLLDSGAISADYGVLNDPVYTDGAIGAKKVLFVGLGEKEGLDGEKVKELSNKVAGYVTTKNIDEVTFSDFWCSADFAREIALAFTLADYVPDEQKTERKSGIQTARVLYGSETGIKGTCDCESEEGGCSACSAAGGCANARKIKITKGLWQGIVTGNAVNLARTLNDGSSNIITPERLAQEARSLTDLGLAVDIYGGNELKADNFHALLEVSRGSAREPYMGIMNYHYSDDAPTIALLGKGLTFDSGGTSQKPAKGMEAMRMDMCGAGNVLAIMQAVAQLHPKVNVIGMFGAVENKDSATSYNPGDIMKTRQGKSVEVINTDAEGRNVLIDLIDKALEYEPDAIIDMATLTGACVGALGDGPKAPAGAFHNENGIEILSKLIEAGERSGEWIWNLPVGDYYQKKLESSRADLKHLGEGGGGASTAAQFLFNFSGDVPHVHLDIAGTAMAGNATGWGVQLILDYLLNEE